MGDTELTLQHNRRPLHSGLLFNKPWCPDSLGRKGSGPEYKPSALTLKLRGREQACGLEPGPGLGRREGEKEEKIPTHELS